MAPGPGMQPRDLHVGQPRRARCSQLTLIALLLFAVLLVLDRNFVVSPRVQDDDDDDSGEGVASSLSGPRPRVAQPAPAGQDPRLREPPTVALASPGDDEQPAGPAAASTSEASECVTAQPPALRPLFDSPPTRCATEADDGGARHRCACGRSGLVVVRAEATGRYLTPFWGGGEVFAIGSLDRMPLRRMAFRMEPAGGGGGGGGAPSPWVTLRHVESDGPPRWLTVAPWQRHSLGQPWPPQTGPQPRQPWPLRSTSTSDSTSNP